MILHVDCTENSQGMTFLQELEGLPSYIDDLYAYLYIRPNEVVKIGNHIKLKQGKDQAASYIVKCFQSITTEILEKFCPQKIAFTVDIREGSNRETSKIYQTLNFIQERTNNRALRGYYAYHNTTDKPIAVIKYKIDTSDIPISEVLGKLNILESMLNQIGGGLHSIDYTRDFSGVLEKE